MAINPSSISLANLNGTNGFRIDGIDPNDRSGFSVSSAGDINGDGFDDVIIGAFGAGLFTGESYVVFGQATGFAASLDLNTLNGTNGFRVDGIDGYDLSGRSVSSAGDVNGDGFDDFIIGAQYADPGGNSNAGESYVVFGKSGGFSGSFDLATLNGTNGFRINGIDVGDNSGRTVSSAGDMNGDGFDDIIIGAPGANSSAGESFVVFGNAGGFAGSFDLANLNGTNGFRIDGINIGDSSGLSVSAAGDVNGDGFEDIIVGAQYAGLAGQSYVIFGKAGGFAASIDLSTLNGINGFRIDGIDTGDKSGIVVSSAGDVNGDGFDDIIVGASAADPGGNLSAGESYVVFGKASGFGASLDLSTLDGTNGFQLSGEAEHDNSGRSVSSAGDVNGDGFDDIIIGALYATSAPGASFYGNGTSYVVYGKASGFAANLNLSTLNGTNGFKIIGDIDVSYSGRSVSSAGDVNGDGFADLIIGADDSDPIYGGSGTSYVVFGGRSLESVTITGTRIGLTHNGGFGDDIINALDGDDIIFGWEGDDLINAGADSDTVEGGSGDDDINGGSSDDNLRGDAGNDVIRGGSGNDMLTGNTGADDLRGGSGNDIYVVDAFDTVIEAASSGIDTVRSSVSYSLGNNLERLILTGTANLNGTGNSLANILTGNTANNLLDGSSGADQLIGGKGRDTLTGGSGSDDFKFTTSDSGQTAAAMDRITDFTIGAVNVGDEFDFSSILSIGGSANSTTANEASIDQSKGITTYAAGSGNNMTDALNDIANRFTLSGDGVGEFALFRIGGTGDYHIFVSDGVAGVTAGDVVVQLQGINAIGSINLTGGDLTILT